MSAHVYVNGRFLARPVTGVERFARMILAQWDAGAGAAGAFTVLVPKGTPAPAFLRHIPVRAAGAGGGHAWEQGPLAWASRDGVLFNPCNSGPVARGRSLTVLHDAWVYRHPDHFSRAYRMLHQRLGRMLARRSRLATVSRFSAGELGEVFGIDPARIPVVPNAADHLDAVTADAGAVERLGLTDGRYLLMVGSFAPNKNMPAAIAAFERIARDGERLVIVGAEVRSFANVDPRSGSGAVVRAGRVDDATLVALYRGARALVFPSLYEGFGIPPLEAMRLGTPVVAGDIGPVRETCGDAALYCDPRSVDDIGRAMRAVLDDDAVHARLAARADAQGRRFSWAASADALRGIIDTL